MLGRFARGSTAAAGGSGLGLALVAQQAALHGGSIELSDGPLGGLRATLTVSTDPADSKISRGDRAPRSPAEQQHRRHRRRHHDETDRDALTAHFAQQHADRHGDDPDDDAGGGEGRRAAPATRPPASRRPVPARNGHAVSATPVSCQALGMAAPADRAEHQHADHVGGHRGSGSRRRRSGYHCAIGHHDVEIQWHDVGFVARGESGLQRRGLPGEQPVEAGRRSDTRSSRNDLNTNGKPLAAQWIRTCSSRGNAGAGHRSCRSCPVRAMTCPVLSSIAGLDLDAAGLQVRVERVVAVAEVLHDVVAGVLVERQSGGRLARHLLGQTVDALPPPDRRRRRGCRRRSRGSSPAWSGRR